MSVTGGQWFDSGCGGPKARWLTDGAIEIQGFGVPKRDLPPAVNQWASLIVSSATKYGLWPSFVAGFMATESGGQQNAHSSCCYGLMGFLPATASSMAGRPVSAQELLGDPQLSVELGAKFIDYLMEKYGNNPIKVAAAYNAGSVKCGAPKGCPDAPNRWNVVTDCAQGKAVDYPGRIIEFSNGALASGRFGARSSGIASSSLVPLVLGAAAVGGAWYVARSQRWLKANPEWAVGNLVKVYLPGAPWHGKTGIITGVDSSIRYTVDVEGREIWVSVGGLREVKS